MSAIKLRMTKRQQHALKVHLLPGDGLEAVAVALCGRRCGDAVHALSVLDILPIPYDECSVRRSDRVTWSTRRMIPLLERAAKYDLAVMKIHSHPGGYRAFSSVDDESDDDMFNSVYGWTDSAYPHVSAVMLPDGEMFGRAILPDGSKQPLEAISVVGDDIQIFTPATSAATPSFVRRHAQMFGAGTVSRLRSMSAAVVGCSGTGSPLIEQLARLGFGRLVLIDPDVVEEKNLNRILNSTREDSYLERPKVEVMARSIAAMGFGTDLKIIRADLGTPVGIKAVAQCDVLFGCMDGVEGRAILNRIAAFYTIPYFDLGVKLEADGKGGIDEAVGAIHYLRPDGDTLTDRRVYTQQQLMAEGLKRTDPAAYRDQVARGYIRGVPEDRPAVISINMQVASIAVNEFLARLHPYRLDDNASTAIVRVNFVGSEVIRSEEGEPSGMFSKWVGRGDTTPLLNMPALSEEES
ncbi:HesA/MoeB/ThiF family protein [Acidisoma silvae]|uniref:ThiF family adenylyltransferase n=1 Tax=Acidisoma silvae TaxID=2802396 RepID=A0A964E1P7_9PROT|nr:ThiF family adenylyltransferase [Acidisoma silvae]MCB8878459.1 ThiF family adenylyltransferase [Acidisoma silvae]